MKLRSRLLTAKNQAAVHGHDTARQQLELAADGHEASEDVADAGRVVVAEVSNRLEVRRQAPGQPHQLDVALALAFQASAGLNAVEVAVDVDLQQHRRVVGRAARGRGHRAFETQRRQIEFLDKRIDDPDRVVLGDEVVQTLWNQRHLTSILAFDKARHTDSPVRYVIELYPSDDVTVRGLSHGLGRGRVYANSISMS